MIVTLSALEDMRHDKYKAKTSGCSCK